MSYIHLELNYLEGQNGVARRAVLLKKLLEKVNSYKWREHLFRTNNGEPRLQALSMLSMCGKTMKKTHKQEQQQEK
jgi:hypothetical protein